MNKARRARQKINKLKGWPTQITDQDIEDRLQGTLALIPRDKDTELVDTQKEDSE